MDMNDFTINRVIGFGTFTITYEVVCNRSEQKDTKYALKRYFLSGAEVVRRALRERNALAPQSSPFIQTLFWAVGSWKTPSIVTTIGSKFNLNDLRRAKGLLKDDIARFYIAEIMCGLEYIHQMGVVHRDVKPENILLSEGGHVIIIDFDMAYELQPDPLQKIPSVIGAGTIEFMAPEIANSAVVTTKADVWSLGCLSAYQVSRRFRPMICDKIKAAMEGVVEISDFDSLSTEIKDFLNACLKVNHTERPEVGCLKSMAFFNSIDWTQAAAVFVSDNASNRPCFYPSNSYDRTCVFYISF
ncbi:unnamed protein product [Rodentolepis nana]|uniref:non-specific serine/threonine protein kinase n=1 Tax=Rodentolepis nana TaxID=102285 RepID=A0A0R3THX4_RODNA|nr:unnamed protein product [Rodentolepis nana]